MSGPEVPPTPVIGSMGSVGLAMSANVRHQIEAVTGVGLGSVRVHTSPEAQLAAKQLDARAFTVGSNIYLHPKESPADEPLLAHEAAHAIQQSATLHAAKPRGPPSGQSESSTESAEPEAEPLTPAPAGLVQRFPLGPGGELDRYLWWPLVLSKGLIDVLWTLDDPGFHPAMLGVVTGAVSSVLGRFPLVPAHFSPTLAWFERARVLRDWAGDAGKLLTGDEVLLSRGLRRLADSLRGLFSGSWRHFAAAMSATHQTFAWFKGQLSATFTGLGVQVGRAGLGEAIDALAGELRANARRLDQSPRILQEIAESLGCDQAVRSTSDLVSWVEASKTRFLSVVTQLRRAASDLVQSLGFIDPLQTVIDMGKASTGMQQLLIQAADALDDPDSVPDDAPLLRELLPRLRTNAALLPMGIAQAAIWPGSFATGLLLGTRAWVGILHPFLFYFHDWLSVIGRQISSWVETVFDGSIAIITRVFDGSATWLGLVEQLFIAMEPAMLDENTREIKPSLLIRALRKLGVPEELLRKLAESTRALGKVVRHPFRFFRNLVTAMVRGLHQFVGNIGRHLIGSIASWIFGELDIPWQGDFSPAKALGWLAAVIRLTFEHFLEVLERKHPGAADKVRRALRAGTIAVRWIHLLFEKRYAELWTELKEYLYNYWSELVIRVQQLLIDSLMSQGLALLLNFLTPGLRQAVKIVREIYQAIKQLKAQASRMLSVVNSVCNHLADIVDGKLDAAIAAVERLAVRALRWAVRFFADWLGLGHVPRIIRKAVEQVRGVIDAAFEKLIEFTRVLWEWLKQKAADVMEWWRNRSVFQDAAGVVHELYFEGDDADANLMVESTPRVLEEYLAHGFPDPTADEKAIITQIKTRATKINNLKAKTGGSFGQADGEAIRDHFNAIAQWLSKLGRSEAVPTTKVEWTTLKGKYDDGAHMTADPLTINAGNLSGSQPYEASALWKAVNRRGGVYIRGHLLNHHLHGPGSRQNLIPITRSANAQMEKRAEGAVKEAVISQKRVVHFEVFAEFPSRKPTRRHIPEEAELPRAIQMLAYYKKKKGAGWATDTQNPLLSETIDNKLPPDTAP